MEKEYESKFEEVDGTKTVNEGLYARVSTDRQVHDRQLQHFNQYLASRRINHRTEAQYNEKASSRTNKKRPKFDQMMADLKSNRIQRIVCSSMDRFVRSSQDFHKAVAHIKDCQGELHLIKENLTINNGTGPYQSLMSSIFSAFAQFESDLISERTTEGMATTQKLHPFTRYGQAPKIKGQDAGKLIKMYYKCSKRARAYDQRTKGPKFTYTLQEIADRFGVTKGAMSQWIDARVQTGVMKLRQPQKAYELAMDDIEGLVEPEKRDSYQRHIEAGKEKMRQRVFAPVMWPQEIRLKVSNKFGNGYSNKGNANSVKAFKYGTNLYISWLKKQVSTSQVSGIFEDLDAVDIIKEYTEVIDAPSVKALSDDK